MSSPPPLEGVRVVDLSRVLAGPYCTMVLADMGADVVKVERPGSGDETRLWGPPFAEGESAYYLSVNRGKRSCALDLSTPEGSALALELCAGADIVVENFRAGGADRLGVGYDAVRAGNASVVYCSISGFGQGREPTGRPGYDFVLQAESGLMSITGPAGGEPFKVGVAVVDVLAGLHASAGVLAALHRAARTGEGEHLQVSLLDSAFASLVNVGQAALLTGSEPRRHGNAHPHIVPYQDFATAEGRIAVAAPNDGLFRALCRAIGLPELADDERFRSNPDRVEHREALIELLDRQLAEKGADEWLDLLGEAGVPAGKVRSVTDALAAAADAGRPASVEVEHPLIGPLALMGSPISADGALGAATPPPLLGEHTAEVLRELGRSADEVRRLAERGIAGLA